MGDTNTYYSVSESVSVKIIGKTDYRSIPTICSFTWTYPELIVTNPIDSISNNNLMNQNQRVLSIISYSRIQNENIENCETNAGTKYPQNYFSHLKNRVGCEIHEWTCATDFGTFRTPFLPCQSRWLPQWDSCQLRQ